MKVFRAKTLIAEEIVLFVLIFVGFALLVFSANFVQSEEVREGVTDRADKTDKFYAEKFYIELEINEKKVGEEIQFSLRNQEILYGYHDGLVEVYNKDAPGDYILNVYDAEGKLLNKYSLWSARYLYWDTFERENPGGVVELDEGIISAAIYYDHNIGSIKIENEGKETDLKVNITFLKNRQMLLKVYPPNR